jgi:hypothetical protein
MNAEKKTFLKKAGMKVVCIDLDSKDKCPASLFETFSAMEYFEVIQIHLNTITPPHTIYIQTIRETPGYANPNAPFRHELFCL